MLSHQTLSIWFNSFAANFLTILFSQCHIYFIWKGHSGKTSLKILPNFIFSIFSFHKYLKFEVSKSRLLWTRHSVCKQRDFNTVREGVQVADRRRWQSAMTSPIGDVGSERVKTIWHAINRFFLTGHPPFETEMTCLQVDVRRRRPAIKKRSLSGNLQIYVVLFYKP